MNKLKMVIYRGKAGGQKGRYRWKLVAANNRIIATSHEGYVTAWRAENRAIALVEQIAAYGVIYEIKN